MQCKRSEFDPWVENTPWRRKCQSSPVFLPGKSHGQRSLAGYSPWGHKELDTTEQLTHNNISNKIKSPFHVSLKHQILNIRVILIFSIIFNVFNHMRHGLKSPFQNKVQNKFLERSKQTNTLINNWEDFPLFHLNIRSL